MKSAGAPMSGAVAVALVLASALAFGAGQDAGTAAPKTAGKHKTVTVKIGDMTFTPEKVQVHPGDTIVWQNDDLVAHTVTGEPIDSPPIEAGKSFEWTATRAGTIHYTCTLHPDMNGTVIVK